ncbi:hypothetical protein V6N11_039652 [Hibiscus sabdariffa]|uniref:Integrase zinc-binding domain-containing protein n=1 Tax=Hibiscus sabdariffa TaxID=183260 RepID=A0ABR2SNW3_9ROSI
MNVSFPQVEILDAVREETETSPELLQLQQGITQGELGSDWAVQEGLIFFKGMKLATSEFVQNCLVCQRHKWQNLQPAGLLQPPRLL